MRLKQTARKCKAARAAVMQIEPSCIIPQQFKIIDGDLVIVWICYKKKLTIRKKRKKILKSNQTYSFFLAFVSDILKISHISRILHMFEMVGICGIIFG